MRKELKYGQMVKDMKDNIRMDKKRDRENLIGLMDRNMKENYWMECHMEKEFIFGRMEKRYCLL